MKYYIENNTGRIVRSRYIRDNNKDKAIPEILNKEILDTLGFSEVIETLPPKVGELELAVIDGADFDGNNYILTWKVQDMFSDNINENGVVISKKKQEQYYKNNLISKAKDDITKAIQSHINNTVVSNGYDNDYSISKYLVQGNPFYDECKAISLWIGSVWKKAIEIQNEVENGNKVIPTIDEVLNELPKYGM